MAKYRDFDDDYEYEDESYIYEEKPVGRRNSRVVQEEEIQDEVKPEKPKKKRKRWVLILVFAIEIILLLVLIVVWYLLSKMEMIKYTPINKDAVIINKELTDDTIEVLEGYTNILLLGTDARDNTVEGLTKLGENHTDSIIIASINIISSY